MHIQDVLYARGLYSCYTLSVDLHNVCDATQSGLFNPSPNDPSTGTCMCPDQPNCTGVDFFPLSTLYLSLYVHLAQYSNVVDSTGSLNCTASR